MRLILLMQKSSTAFKAQDADLETDLGFEEGQAVSLAASAGMLLELKPSLQRVFLAGEKPVEFVPRGPEDAQAANKLQNLLTISSNS